MTEIILDCRTHDWTDGERKLKIAVWGTVVFEDGEQEISETVKRLALSFIQKKEKAFAELSGIFSALVIDETACCLMKSILGSPVDLYFTKIQEGYAVSNKLYLLLDKMEQVRPCEEKIRNHFLRLGFLEGSATLIRNVEKVPAAGCIVIEETGGIRKSFFSKTQGKKRPTKQDAKEIYPALIKNAVTGRTAGEKKTAVTLSGGYDSNYLLWNIRQFSECEIDAFCIGGKKGRNEIEKAKLLADRYDKVRLHTAFVDSETLNRYPEIIWRLEGCVYERGIFLQYELAKAVAGAGYTVIIEGDGADQVMRENFCFSDHMTARDVWHDRPDVALRYIVLPKSLKMMHSFGIQSSYPYLDHPVIQCLDDLKEYNGTTKRFHKQIVSECIGKEAESIICDSGGTTHLAALFDDVRVLSEESRAWNLPSYEELRTRCDERETERILDTYFKGLYLELFYKIFIDDRKWWKEQYVKEDKSSVFRIWS